MFPLSDHNRTHSGYPNIFCLIVVPPKRSQADTHGGAPLYLPGVRESFHTQEKKNKLIILADFINRGRYMFSPKKISPPPPSKLFFLLILVWDLFLILSPFIFFLLFFSLSLCLKKAVKLTLLPLKYLTRSTVCPKELRSSK